MKKMKLGLSAARQMQAPRIRGRSRDSLIVEDSLITLSDGNQWKKPVDRGYGLQNCGILVDRGAFSCESLSCSRFLGTTALFKIVGNVKSVVDIDPGSQAPRNSQR